MTHLLLILHGQNTHGIHSPKFYCSSDPSLLTLFVGLWKIERGGGIGTYSGIGQRVEEAKGGSTGLKVVQRKYIDNEDE